MCSVLQTNCMLKVLIRTERKERERKKSPSQSRHGASTLKGFKASRLTLPQCAVVWSEQSVRRRPLIMCFGPVSAFFVSTFILSFGRHKPFVRSFITLVLVTEIKGIGPQSQNRIRLLLLYHSITHIFFTSPQTVVGIRGHRSTEM